MAQVMKVSRLINFNFSMLYTIGFDYVIKTIEIRMVWQDMILGYRRKYKQYTQYKNYQ